MKLNRVFIIGALLCFGLVTASGMKSAGGGKRFTLRLGQGFRFKDGVVVVAKPDEQPDIVFKYLPPQGAGQALRYNEQSQQVEMGLGPALTSAVPVLLSTHISAFDTKPDVARITSCLLYTSDAADE